MAEFLDLPGGRVAYDVSGEGPLLVCVPGMGDLRASFRHLTPRLVAAGYRVAVMDLRGHGESSAAWDSYAQTDGGDDVLALTRHLGGPAVVVGHSFAGGVAVAAAVRAPAEVAGVVLISASNGAPRLNPLLKPVLRLVLRSPALWARYVRSLYPGAKPPDLDDYLAGLRAALRRPGRTEAFARTTPLASPNPIDAMGLTGRVACPALLVTGEKDRDMGDPRVAAGALAAALSGPTEIVVIPGAGHYPHAQFPDPTAAAVLSFLEATVRA